MVRLLILIVLVALIVLVIRAVHRRASRQAAESAQGEYRVLEQTGGGEAHVLIARGPHDAVLIGSVPVADEDFGERYAELIVTAEDRAATLNASRQLHGRR